MHHKSASMRVLCLAAASLVFSGSSIAAEVDSPEQFMLRNYGWTLNGIDSEVGFFGKHKRFACFDDRLGPTEDVALMSKRRWATQCNTIRSKGENLPSMLFVTWANPGHAKPVTREEYETSVARGMAGDSKDDGVEPQCKAKQLTQFNRPVELVDCAMVLSFGTFYASYFHFESRGWRFYVRSQNASNQPSTSGPVAAVEDLLSRLSFE